MKKKYLFIILLLSVTVFVNSCATIFYGGKHTVSIDSSPRGAEVYVNGNNMSEITPCKIRLSRKVRKTTNNKRNQLNYEIKKEGYKDFKYTNDREFRVLLPALDFFAGGWPAVIDFISGAYLKYDRHVFAALYPEEEQILSDGTRSKLTTEQKSAVSDVDMNIPNAGRKFENRYALIIGNEDYQSYQKDLGSEVNVKYAINDALIFKEYAVKVLGVPAENVILLRNAKAIEMHRAIEKVSLINKALNGKSELFVYYAGHGLPDETSKEAYIMPVDLSGTDIKWAIKLNDFYEKLTEYPSKRVTVFIDACFSGGARYSNLVAARAVKIKPKADQLGGNLIVFSATSGEESALPYNEMRHGIFSYYLFKKLQDTRGNITYEELQDYLAEKVTIKSVLINNKPQNPKVNVSPKIDSNWKSWKLR